MHGILGLLLWSLAVSVTAESAESCLRRCGRGGLCLPGRGAASCGCELASPGLYQRDPDGGCRRLADHCLSAPCHHTARCVSTFGGYFCRCPLGRFGKDCRRLTAEDVGLVFAEGVYVFYKTLPEINMTREMYVSIIRPGSKLKIRIMIPDDNRETVFSERDLIKSNLKGLCLKDLKSDNTSCSYIPEGELPTVRVVVSKSTRMEGGSRDVWLGQSAGRLKEVTVELYNGRLSSYRHSYNILVDIQPASMSCLPKAQLYGCSSDIENPRKINKCQLSNISVISIAKQECFLETTTEVLIKENGNEVKRMWTNPNNIKIPKDLKFGIKYNLLVNYYKYGVLTNLSYEEYFVDNFQCWFVIERCQPNSNHLGTHIKEKKIYERIPHGKRHADPTATAFLEGHILMTNSVKTQFEKIRDTLLLFKERLKSKQYRKDLEEYIYRTLRFLRDYLKKGLETSELLYKVLHISLLIYNILSEFIEETEEEKVDHTNMNVTINEFEDNMEEEETTSVNVVNHVFSTVEVFTNSVYMEQEVIFNSKVMTTVVKKDSVVNLKENPIKLPGNAATLLLMENNLPPGTELVVAVTKFKKNPFPWADTKVDGPVIDVTIKDNNKKLEGLHLRLNMEIEIKSDSLSASLEKEEVKVHKFLLQENVWGLLYFNFTEFSVELMALCMVDQIPDYNTIKSFGIKINESNTEIMFDATKENFKSIVYLGVFSVSESRVNYSFKMTNMQCLQWSGRDWMDASCKVGYESGKRMLSCECKHSSIFSSKLFTPPHIVNPVTDIHLFRNFFDNPFVGMVVGLFLVVLIFLLFWARYRDRKDKKRNTAELLADCPNGKYPYLIGIYTGSYLTSGTTADVCIQIHGSKDRSLVHNLKSRIIKALQVGQDDWFLIYTPRDLGNITSISIFHNDLGSSPDWFCRKVVIYDITNENTYLFEISEWITILNTSSDGLMGKTFTNRKTDRDSQELEKDQDKVISNIALGIRTSHNWLCIFMKHQRSPFTRSQLIMCTFTMLFFSMLLSMMYYGVLGSKMEDMPAVELKIADYIIALQSFLIAFPVTFIIMYLFERSINIRIQRIEDQLKEYNKGGEKEERESKLKKVLRNHFSSQLQGFPLLPVTLAEEAPSTLAEQIWLALAWTIATITILTCTFFMVLYSLKFGRYKSIQWLISFFIGWTQDLVLFQPLNVIVFSIILAYIFGRVASVDRFNFKVISLQEPILSLKTALKMREHNPVYRQLASDEIKVRRMMRDKKEFYKWFFWRVGSTISLFILAMFIVSNNFAEKQLEEVEYFRDSVVERGALASIYDQHRLIQLMKNSVPLYCSMSREPEEIKTKGICNRHSPRVVGVPRLRQQRVKPSINILAHEFSEVFSSALPPLNIFTEDIKTYQVGWISSGDKIIRSQETWNYSYHYYLQTTSMFGYSLELYDGGGYAHNLGYSYEHSRDKIVKLKRHKWIDEHTRAVFLEYNLYDPNTNLYFAVVYLAEQFTENIYTVKLSIEGDTFKRSGLTIELSFIVVWSLFVALFFIMCMQVISEIPSMGVGNALLNAKMYIEFACCIFGALTLASCLTRILYFKFYMEGYLLELGDQFVSLDYPVYETFLFMGSLGLFIIALGLRLIFLFSDRITIVYFKYFLFLRPDTLLALLILVFFINSFFNVMVQYFGCPAYPGLITIIYDRAHVTKILSNTMVKAEHIITIVYFYVFIFLRILFIAAMICYYQDAADYLGEYLEVHDFHPLKYFAEIIPCLERYRRQILHRTSEHPAKRKIFKRIHTGLISSPVNKTYKDQFSDLQEIIDSRGNNLKKIGENIDKILKLIEKENT